MIQFFAPDILKNPVLPESDSQHCIRVLRMNVGDEVEVIDGCGFRYKCRIIDPHQKHTQLDIISKEKIEKPWRGNITVAVAPTKHLDRMEWMVEKLTETGIDRIVPVLCRRSERKELKQERLQKIAVSAMKQSLKAEMPEIARMTPLTEFLSGCSATRKFVAYCDKNCERRTLAKIVEPFEDTAILIGPEGDFSPEEISEAIASGFMPVTLGDCRLRTETAALAAVQTIHTINQLNQ